MDFYKNQPKTSLIDILTSFPIIKAKNGAQNKKILE